MDIARSDIVKAAAGRDKGKLFFVLDVEGDFLLLADGKTRKLERPKRKKRKHVVFQARIDCRATEKIRSGDRLVDFIDGASLFNGPYSDLCTVDGVHPNDAGFFRSKNTSSTARTRHPSSQSSTP